MNNTYEYILKKYNIKVGKEFFVEIPNMGRDHLAKLFAELNFNVGAEIGVDKGGYSEVLCKANPGLHLYSIDPWSTSAYEPGMSGVDEKQEFFDNLYDVTVKRLAPYNCTIVRKDSMSALKDFADNSLDFVYIDANHDFVNFTNDLHYWLKKVKVGGIMSGHDYCYFSYKKFNHVKRVVEVYTRCYRMRPYFVVGSFTCDKGLTRDKYRSWFWVKT
ncbi:MAG: class I SAM-dependent methyltransferase [bacterium]|nr:class I SAM-dependent methyltransferase [bacterium]